MRRIVSSTSAARLLLAALLLCGLIAGRAGASDCNADGVPDEGSGEVRFLRGDANEDGSVDIADVASIRAWLFSGGRQPICSSTMDYQDDGSVDSGADDVSLFFYLLVGNPSPPAPPGVDELGPDPTPDQGFPSCPEYCPKPSEPLADHLILDFEGCPEEIVGQPGEFRAIEIHGVLTTLGNHSSWGRGPMGWSLGISVEGGRIRSIDVDGVRVLIRDHLRFPSAVEEVALTDIGLGTTILAEHSTDGRSGAIGAHALDQFRRGYALALEGTARIARIVVEVTIPEGGEADALVLRYEDGFRAPGGRPVKNLVVLDGTAQVPVLGECRVPLRSGSGGLRLPGDANQDGSLDLSDPIWLLGHLFLGASPSLPCEAGTASSPGPGELLLLDLNGDEGIDLSDAVYALAFLFSGGPPPALGASCVPIPGCPEVGAGCGGA